MLLQCVSGENYWLLHLPHSWAEERTEKELPECSGERSPWGVCCGFKKAGLLLRPLTLTQCLSRIQLGIESGVLQGLGSTTNMWACFAPIKMIKRTWVDSPKMVNPELVGRGWDVMSIPLLPPVFLWEDPVLLHKDMLSWFKSIHFASLQFS